jgi:hypothetical protein
MKEVFKHDKNAKHGEKGYGTVKEQKSWRAYDNRMKRMTAKHEALQKKYPEQDFVRHIQTKKHTKYLTLSAGRSPKETKNDLESFDKKGGYHAFTPHHKKEEVIARSKSKALSMKK